MAKIILLNMYNTKPTFLRQAILQIMFIIKIEVSKLKMPLIYKIIRALSLPIIVHKRVHQTMSFKVVIILYM